MVGSFKNSDMDGTVIIRTISEIDIGIRKPNHRWLMVRTRRIGPFQYPELVGGCVR